MKKQFLEKYEKYLEMRIDLKDDAIDIIRSFALGYAVSGSYFTDNGIDLQLSNDEMVEGVGMDVENRTVVFTTYDMLWINDLEWDDVIEIAEKICEHGMSH